jgi:hypothetical protein
MGPTEQDDLLVARQLEDRALRADALLSDSLLAITPEELTEACEVFGT